MFATISDKEYTYSIWNNEKLNDSLIAMDTETTVRERPEIPQLVLTTASDGKLHVIIPNDKLDTFLNMHKNARFVFYNISFDFWVIKQFLPNNSVLYTAADNNKLHDYMLLDMLYRLAVNDNFPVMRNLGETSKFYANMVIDKEDPYRMRYEEILNKDLMSVPIGFLEYAIKDTIVTWIGFRQLFSKAKQLAYSYGVSSETLNSFGLFTESLQVKAAISLTKITNNGIRLDTTLSNEMHREIEKVIWETVQKLDSEYPEDEDRDIPGLFKKCKRGEFVLTDNGTPKISRKRLGMIFEDVAKQLNSIKEIKLVAPMTKTKKISTSMPLWSDYTAHNDFLTKWKIWSDNTKAAQFFCKLNKENIYPRYKFFVRTGRTSQQDPNCQQIKKGRMREIIIPKKGFALVAADYSFIELRTLAHIMERLFKKSIMAEVIRTGKDPHAWTGAMLVNMEYEEFTALKKTNVDFYDKWRQNAKACNFGIPGGLSAPSLLNYAKNIYHIKDWTIETARNFRDKICNQIYPELGKYLQEDSMRIMCESLGCNTEDAWELFEIQGERSPCILNCVKNIVKGEPFKKDGIRYQDGFVNKVWDNLLKLNNNSTLHSLLKERTANLDLMKKLFWTSTVTLTGRVRGKVSFTQNKNTPFQGLAADGAKLAAYRLIKEEEQVGYNLVNFVHDEFLFEFPNLGGYVDKSKVDYVLKVMCEEMEKLTPGVPIAGEYTVAKSWTKKNPKMKVEGNRIYF